MKFTHQKPPLYPHKTKQFMENCKAPKPELKTSKENRPRLQAKPVPAPFKQGAVWGRGQLEKAFLQIKSFDHLLL